MASDLQRVVSWLYRRDLEEGEIDFDQVLEKAVCHVLDKDQIDAEAYVQAEASRIWSAVCQKSAEDVSRGLNGLLQVSDGSMRRGIWRPSVANDSPRRVELLRARSRPTLLRAIDDLSPREYEGLGCLVAMLLGADRTLLTPPGGEGGVDFFARLRQPSRGHVFGGVGAPIRIIGQTKKYGRRVTLSQVRDFITTIADVCHGSKQVEPVPGWFRDLGGPVVGWMVGHSGFQSGALTVARNHGIVTSESLDLAEVCAQSRALTRGFDPVERVRIMLDRVDELLSAG